MTPQTIIRAFPEAKALATRAFYAYRATPEEGGHHFGEHPGDPHYRHRPCAWCGRTRYAVCYGDGVPACSGPPDTEGVIRNEEGRFLALLERAPAIIEKHAPDAEALTGERLAWLQHTHGLPPDVVEACLDVTLPEGVHNDYLKAMDTHREASTA